MGFKDVVRKTAHWLLPVVVVACSLLALAAAFFGRTASAKDITVENGVLDVRRLDVTDLTPRETAECIRREGGA